MDPKKVLFRVGDRDIIENGLYSLVGPSINRFMAASYDSETNKSTWVSPTGSTFTAGGSGLMATVIDSDLLEDAFDTPKPYIHFKGGRIEFDFNYRPTPDQIQILQNWYEELHKAGIGSPISEFTREDARQPGPKPT